MIIITIDGPAASGKSSVSRCLARRLNYYYLYSGLLYRGCAYVLMKYGNYTKVQRRSIHPGELSDLFNNKRIKYTYDYEKGESLFFDGIDITPHLKSAKMDDYASMVSIEPDVRREVGIIQHAISVDHNIIADGRDMGTVMFPDATVKFFLTASVGVRAERWRLDQAKRGNNVTYDEAVAILSERDQRDTIRAHSPLEVAQDAIMVDNTTWSAEQTCNFMEQKIREKVPTNA